MFWDALERLRITLETLRGIPETLHALQTVPQMLSVRECGEGALHTPREGDIYGLVWSDFAPHGVQSPFLSRCVEHRRSTQVFVSLDVVHVACENVVRGGVPMFLSTL